MSTNGETSHTRRVISLVAFFAVFWALVSWSQLSRIHGRASQISLRHETHLAFRSTHELEDVGERFTAKKSVTHRKTDDAELRLRKAIVTSITSLRDFEGALVLGTSLRTALSAPESGNYTVLCLVPSSLLLSAEQLDALHTLGMKVETTHEELPSGLEKKLHNLYLRLSVKLRVFALTRFDTVLFLEVSSIVLSRPLLSIEEMLDLSIPLEIVLEKGKGLWLQIQKKATKTYPEVSQKEKTRRLKLLTARADEAAPPLLLLAGGSSTKCESDAAILSAAESAILPGEHITDLIEALNHATKSDDKSNFKRCTLSGKTMVLTPNGEQHDKMRSAFETIMESTSSKYTRKMKRSVVSVARSRGLTWHLLTKILAGYIEAYLYEALYANNVFIIPPWFSSYTTTPAIVDGLPSLPDPIILSGLSVRPYYNIDAFMREAASFSDCILYGETYASWWDSFQRYLGEFSSGSWYDVEGGDVEVLPSMEEAHTMVLPSEALRKANLTKEGLVVRFGGPGQSCTDSCGEVGLKCDGSSFNLTFLRDIQTSCDVLRDVSGECSDCRVALFRRTAHSESVLAAKIFQTQKKPHNVSSEEIYPARGHSHICYVNPPFDIRLTPSCKTAHSSFERLCPCLPGRAEGAEDVPTTPWTGDLQFDHFPDPLSGDLEELGLL